MRPYEREGLLERVERDSATIGARIPDRAPIGGEEILLRRRIMKLRAADTPGEAHRELVVSLRQERQKLLGRLENDDLSYEAGQKLAERIVGLDRALEVLDGIEKEDDIEAEMAAQEKADRERWLQFLNRALGRTDDGPLGRP